MSAAASAARSASNIPNLQRDRREEDREHRGAGRRHAACRRSRLPDEHGRQAEAPGLEGRGPACRRGARRHDRRAADRRARLSAWKSPPPPSRQNAARRARRRPSCSRRSAMCAPASSTSAGKAVEALPEFEPLRDSARDIKDHTLDNLDLYLEAYEAKVTAAGGQVHWAETAEEARDIVLDICRAAGARTVTKGKSMITEEIALNDFLEKPRHPPGRDRPRRIHHPAARRASEPHHRAGRAPEQGAGRGGFPPRAHASAAGRATSPSRRRCSTRRARVLRSQYFAADVGITGANFLVAETGTSIIVTNEGNGDLTQILPRVHIVVASIEKIVPTLEDAAQILRVLARSATGQEMSVYTTLSTGPRRPGDPDGPERVPRRAARQWPLGDARHRVPGHAALHPLRRLHEPLPGLSRGRRPRLWLGLSRADGRGADAVADRRRQGRAPAQRLDLLRPLRERVPDAASRCRR